MWLVCAKIVKCGRGEKELTQDSMFSAGHEPGAFGEGHEFTKGSALGAGHAFAQSIAFGAGHESTQTGPWDRRQGSAQPADL